MKKYIIYTDGASRGNPGPAASAFVIMDSESQILIKRSVYLGETTNNVAEYMAVKEALKAIKEEFGSLLPVQVIINSDSRLIVEQLSGRFKIKDEKMKRLYQEIKPLEIEVGAVFYNQIPREKNTVTDQLANNELDSQK
ncbi:MAG: reverse transcriptase-like protein [Armatimonadetes bacterium]|nr:MAG: reverse transcriptase-like protein [Armatimonadota bacterium]